MTELYVDDRSWLLTEEASRHRFGPVDAPLLVLNDEDADGCLWWCDLPEGWDAPEATTPVDQRPYGDGGFDGDTTYGSRTLAFGGDVAGFTACPDRPAALRAWRRLLAVAASRRPVLYTAPDEGGEWSLWLRASGQPNGPRWVDDRSFEWSFVMVAPDPMKFDASQVGTPRTAGLPQPAPGLRYPWRYNLVYGRADPEHGAIAIHNAGDEDAQVRYELRGPAPRPTVVNDRTGVQFTVARNLDLGDVLTVDTRSATVRLNGVSVFVDLIGSFPLVVPGENTVRWFIDGAVPTLPPDAPADASTLTVYTASTRK